MNITRIAIRRPVTISMFVVAVILFGLVSLDRLPLNLLPDISYPSLTIQTEYEDAAPEEVEALVTRPIEEAVSVVSGLARLTSISQPGQSQVVLEFTWNSNMDLASLDAREKLDLIALPRDAKKPVILRFDPAYDPIMRIQLHGELGLSRLRYLAERELKKLLESTEGVAAVKVVGGREEQIRIEIDEKRLAELNIAITDVTRVIEQANLNRASGSLYDLDANYMVRMLNEFRSVEEIQRMIVRDQDGRRVVLGDVARVWRGTRERDIVARLDGMESVELGIYKEGDANTVSVSQAVRAKLLSLADGQSSFSGVEHRIVFDQAEFIQQSVRNVLSAAVLGGLLATAVLFVFLRHLRSTLIIGVSIPISIMATFALMYQTGTTLNIMSLGGIALGVGMLVDNSIVVLESAYRYKGTGGSLPDAVYRGTSEVGTAVVASTLTTVAVFLPLVFIEGIAGQLFRDQALTITYSLFASLFVALTFIPMALALRMKPLAPEAREDASTGSAPNDAFVRYSSMRGAARFVIFDVPQVVVSDLRLLGRGAGRLLLKPLAPLLDQFGSAFERVRLEYPGALSKALDNKLPVFAAAAVLVGLAAGAYRSMGAELIPPLSQGEFSFRIQLPEGRPLEHTDRVVAGVEERILQLPGVETVFSSVGGGNENQFTGGIVEENIGRISIVMEDRRDRQAEERTIGRVREELSRFPEVTYTFSRPTLFSFRTPVEVEIYAFNLEDQRKAADLVVRRLGQIEGLTDIQTTTAPGSPEIQIRFDRERLARLGLDEGAVAGALRNKIRGEVASRYREDDKQIDILVRADEPDRQTVADIRNLVVNDVRSSAAGPGSRGRAGNIVDFAQPERNSQSGPQSALTLQRAGGTQPMQPGADSGDARRVAPVLLEDVADVAVGRGPSEIRRIRAQRAAVVSANVAGRDLAGISAEIRGQLQEVRGELPVNTVVALGGQNEELDRSYRSLLFALGLAVFLVYMVMASQFESLVHPLVILFTVPFAIVGVILSLWVTGIAISVMVFLGVIILAGVVVNNAIVLIDYANRLRRDGVPRREALLRAGQVRLRPILMTTLTTVLGLIPLAVGRGEGAEVSAPMAVTVMGGLLFATLLTLFFIPVVYELVDRKIGREST